MMSSQSQLFGRFPNSGDVEVDGRLSVALTFDDGPNEPYTGQLAALLERRGVRATFFHVAKSVWPRCRAPRSRGSGASVQACR